ncbi:MAG: ferritin-like domain-containing protein [Oscillospiraceae bacterium]
MERQTPMEREQAYDFRQHDRIWQRVAPGLTPFPEVRGPAPRPPMTGTETAAGTGTAMSTAAELRLPGAEANPCCLGNAAEESLPVLVGFMREERQTRRWERCLLSLAPDGAARGVLQRLINGSGAILRRLAAINFLITGGWPECESAAAVSCGCGWAEGLRTAYHMEACGALNYARAAEGTTDPCLERMMTELSREKYARADRLLALLSDCRRR